MSFHRKVRDERQQVRPKDDGPVPGSSGVFKLLFVSHDVSVVDVDLLLIGARHPSVSRW